MKAKAFLGRAYRLDLKITAKLEQLEQLRSIAYKVTSVLREDKVSNGSSSKGSLEDSIIKIVVAEKEVNTAIDRFVDVKREIANIISLVGNEDEKLLLELRYLCFNSWEQIAVKMRYSYSYTFRIHRQAIESVERQLIKRGDAE